MVSGCLRLRTAGRDRVAAVTVLDFVYQLRKQFDGAEQTDLNTHVQDVRVVRGNKSDNIQFAPYPCVLGIFAIQLASELGEPVSRNGYRGDGSAAFLQALGYVLNPFVLLFWSAFRALPAQAIGLAVQEDVVLANREIGVPVTHWFGFLIGWDHTGVAARTAKSRR